MMEITSNPAAVSSAPRSGLLTEFNGGRRAMPMRTRGSTREDRIAGQILLIARRDGFRRGSRLVEQHLADRIGVSRGPVRAGLKALAEAGLVVGEKHRGYVLAKSPTSREAQQAVGALDDGEQTYRRIADDRVAGRLPDIVTEAELSRRYDVSRTQLLRLLDRIAGEGWVTKQPGYGWRFAETVASPQAYAKATAFRAVIEPAALLEASYRLSPDVIERLRSQQRHLYERGFGTLTMGEIFQSGCAFHEAVIGGAGNPFYLEALRRVNAIRRLIAYRTFSDRDGMRRHVREHLKLLDLLEAGDHAAAARLMQRHLARPPRVRWKD